MQIELFSQQQTLIKKTISELEKMSRNEMANYIVYITQTPICSDNKYCNLLMLLFMKK